MDSDKKEQQNLLTPEAIDILGSLAKVLEKIYRRMKAEGYDIIDNKIIHLATGKEYDPTLSREQSIKGNRKRAIS